MQLVGEQNKHIALFIYMFLITATRKATRKGMEMKEKVK